MLSLARRSFDLITEDDRNFYLRIRPSGSIKTNIWAVHAYDFVRTEFFPQQIKPKGVVVNV